MRNPQASPLRLALFGALAAALALPLNAAALNPQPEPPALPAWGVIEPTPEPWFFVDPRPELPILYEPDPQPWDVLQQLGSSLE
jgi:hypothetical protein